MKLDHEPHTSGLKKRSHEWIDARSLSLAVRIAEKIRRDPSLLEHVRDTIRRWKARMKPWPHALREWEEILQRSSVEEILALLVDPGEEGKRRRQSNPFTGILSPRERREIFEQYEKIGT
jgi:hypothetical protein